MASPSVAFAQSDQSLQANPLELGRIIGGGCGDHRMDHGPSVDHETNLVAALSLLGLGRRAHRIDAIAPSATVLHAQDLIQK